MKQFIKILLMILPGIVVVLLLFSVAWNFIAKAHIHQFEETVASQAAQQALKEKVAYKTTEYRTKRTYLEAQNRYQLEKIRLRIETLPRYAALKFYSAVGLLAFLSLSLIILAGGYTGAKIRQSSVCTARIGPHSEIPVHYKDLQHFYPIAVNLSLAEIEASVSTSHENAYQISRRMLDDITHYTRVLADQRSRKSSGSSTINMEATGPSQHLTYTPNFAHLLNNEMIAPNKPLILGYNRQGQPQYRTLQDLKTVAVAGWQGSGKTLSMAYLTASIILAYRTQAYIIDPHKHHAESLSSLLQPLEKTGYVTNVNPFETPLYIRRLNETLDRRLNGKELSTPGILLIIDEMERMAKMDCFDELIAFLSRCTEETRKANITFIGSAHKWTARHFKGRADIRGSMNSMLIHKTKPSQADLLLEDAASKHLVKQLQQAGEAILCTDYDAAPTIVSMPLCTRDDIQTIANMLDVKTSGTGNSIPQPNVLFQDWDGQSHGGNRTARSRLKIASHA